MTKSSEKFSKDESPDHTKGITFNRKIMSVESSVTEGGLLQALDGCFPAGSFGELRNNHNTRHDHIISFSFM